MRILIVEDDPTVRGLLEQLLTAGGHCVQTAATGFEALALTLYDVPTVPDLALLDLVLPGATGVALADELRRSFPGIRLLFMTGWQEQDRLQREARQRGPVLLKPFGRDELFEAIDPER